MHEQTVRERGETIPPPMALLQMATGYWESQAIYVAAKLGIADLLGDGPKTSFDLAQGTRTHPGSLRRLMRTLVSLGVFIEEEDNRFALTPIGNSLLSDVPGSLRSMVLTLGEEHYQAWGNLLQSVKTGEPAFNHVYKMGLFQYFAQNPAAGEVFNGAMDNITELLSLAIVLAYDFSKITLIADIGGGRGALISAILKMNPKLNGILYDTAPVIEEAKRVVNGDGLAENCKALAGDFFKSVPNGADAYILKNVLHDWDDEHCVKILKNCCNAMTRNGRVLLVETVLRPNGAASFDRLQDLNMLVISGGRERSEAEYRSLFEVAGLRLTKIVPTISPVSVIEGVPKWIEPSATSIPAADLTRRKD
ncbi:MAG TPA: methyltransferase [Terriglobia bacterium]|nr:methyltransferase [Terriglobia bacterium]